VFEPELKQGELVELALDSDFQCEYWMFTTSARWRSPTVKAIVRLSKDREGGAAQQKRPGPSTRPQQNSTI
jgi:hypothetical protein